MRLPCFLNSESVFFVQNFDFCLNVINQHQTIFDFFIVICAVSGGDVGGAASRFRKSQCSIGFRNSNVIRLFSPFALISCLSVCFKRWSSTSTTACQLLTTAPIGGQQGGRLIDDQLKSDLSCRQCSPQPPPSLLLPLLWPSCFNAQTMMLIYLFLLYLMPVSEYWYFSKVPLSPLSRHLPLFSSSIECIFLLCVTD